jgi:hypothetical protein
MESSSDKKYTSYIKQFSKPKQQKCCGASRIVRRNYKLPSPYLNALHIKITYGSTTTTTHKNEPPTMKIEEADSYEILTSTYNNTKRYSLDNPNLTSSFTNLLHV